MAPSTEWGCIVLCTLTPISSRNDVMDVDVRFMATGNAAAQVGTVSNLLLYSFWESCHV